MLLTPKVFAHGLSGLESRERGGHALAKLGGDLEPPGRGEIKEPFAHDRVMIFHAGVVVSDDARVVAEGSNIYLFDGEHKVEKEKVATHHGGPEILNKPNRVFHAPHASEGVPRCRHGKDGIVVDGAPFDV
jgi:hypothetical protein